MCVCGRAGVCVCGGRGCGRAGVCACVHECAHTCTHPRTHMYFVMGVGRELLLDYFIYVNRLFAIVTMWLWGWEE